MNGKMTLYTLRLDNANVDLTRIQKTISGLLYYYSPGSDGFLCSWQGCSGFYATPEVWNNLNDCANITCIVDKTIDLSACSSLKDIMLGYLAGGKIIFPSCLENIVFSTHSCCLDFDFLEDSTLKTFQFQSIEGDLDNAKFSKTMEVLSKCAKLQSFIASPSGEYPQSLSSLSGMENLSNTLNTVKIYGFKALSDINALSGFTNLTTLDLHNNSVSDVSNLKSCVALKQLYLNSNRIINLSFLSNMLQLQELNLQDNLIEDTAMEGAEKINNLDVLVNLHNNGILRKLSISGNSVINLSTITALDWEQRDF